MNPSTASARVVVDELVRGGVTDAVLAPGSRSAPLALALAAAERDGRLRLHVRIAVDEGVRRAADPRRVDLREAADVVVLKVQPLGGVRAALGVAEAHGLPCVVSSALESSVGIAAGVALAAALPELPFACGLATVALMSGDVTSTPLLPVDGELPVRRPEPDRLAEVAADRATADRWTARLAQVRAA